MAGVAYLTARSCKKNHKHRKRGLLNKKSGAGVTGVTLGGSWLTYIIELEEEEEEQQAHLPLAKRIRAREKRSREKTQQQQRSSQQRSSTAHRTHAESPSPPPPPHTPNTHSPSTRQHMRSRRAPPTHVAVWLLLTFQPLLAAPLLAAYFHTVRKQSFSLVTISCTLCLAALVVLQSEPRDTTGHRTKCREPVPRFTYFPSFLLSTS